MYTILLNEDKALISTHREAIMQYSNLCDKFQFLIPTVIGENDMTAFDTVMLEYLSPVSHIYRTDFLERSDDLYKEHLQYLLPADTKITAEVGDLELQLTFYKAEMTPDGEVQTPIFKTQSCIVKIIPVANWSQFISSEAFTELDQRIAQLLVLQNEITEIQTQIMEHHDNLIDDDNVSDNTTYSSKKIEEKFLDQTEVETTVDAIIDETVDNKISEQNEKQSITDDDINDLFPNSDDTTDEDSTTTPDDIGNETQKDVITDNDIDNLFK